MYRNKCTKCGEEFETKNPKRVICPGCLYPDKKDLSLKSYNNVLKDSNSSVTKDDQQKPQEDKGIVQKSSGYYVVKDSSQNQGYRKPGYSNTQQGGFKTGGGPRVD